MRRDAGNRRCTQGASWSRRQRQETAADGRLYPPRRGSSCLLTGCLLLRMTSRISPVRTERACEVRQVALHLRLFRQSMSSKAFGKIMRGLEEASAYMDGEREGYKVTVPPYSGCKEHPPRLEHDPGSVLRKIWIQPGRRKTLGRRATHPGGPRPRLPHRHSAQPVAVLVSVTPSFSKPRVPGVED